MWPHQERLSQKLISAHLIPTLRNPIIRENTRQHQVPSGPSKPVKCVRAPSLEKKPCLATASVFGFPTLVSSANCETTIQDRQLSTRSLSTTAVTLSRCLKSLRNHRRRLHLLFPTQPKDELASCLRLITNDHGRTLSIRKMLHDQ